MDIVGRSKLHSTSAMSHSVRLLAPLEVREVVVINQPHDMGAEVVSSLRVGQADQVGYRPPAIGVVDER